MRLFLRYLRPHWAAVLVAMLLSAGSQSILMLDPLLLRMLVDRYATQSGRLSERQFLTGTAILLGAMLAAAFGAWILKNLNFVVVRSLAQRVSNQMYKAAVRQSLELPYSVLEDQRTGEITSSHQLLRGDVDRFISLFIELLFAQLVGVVFAMVYASLLTWVFGAAFVIFAGVVAGVSVISSRRLKPIENTIVARTTELAGSTVETLRNLELVKSLGLAQQELSRLDVNAEQILDLQLLKIRKVRSVAFVQGIFVNLARAALLFILLYFLFTQRITVGQFFSVLLYSYLVLSPMQELGPVINQFRQTEASIERFARFMEHPLEARPRNPATLGPLQAIKFHDVSFQHQGSVSPAVDEVSFHAARGETVAFVGPTGCGKTTLVKLVVGLYAPRSGTIEYNEIDSSRVDPDRLRERVGLVTQDTQLFSGSVRDNLRFVRPDATDAECLEVLRQAAALSFLERVPGGLDARLGEGGVKISGGERQRIAIARALLRRPELLIFDEATSSLDSLTEDEVSQTIRQITAGRRTIAILIAHRLSTVIYADRIYVLNRGRIVEQGWHEDLLGQQGLYASLWRQQTVGPTTAPTRSAEHSGAARRSTG